jgi:hypothetical protein
MPDAFKQKRFIGNCAFSRQIDGIDFQWDVGWNTFRHATFWEGCEDYYISLNVDVILHRGRSISVDNSGCIYSWDIKRLDEYALRMGHPYKHHKRFEESPEITFYLAKSPADELLVNCVHGNKKCTMITPVRLFSKRMVIAEGTMHP